MRLGLLPLYIIRDTTVPAKLPPKLRDMIVRYRLENSDLHRKLLYRDDEEK